MTHEQRPPSTEDIARSGDVQGRGDDTMRGRESVMEPERSTPAAGEVARPDARPADHKAAAGRPSGPANEAHAPLFAANDAGALRQRWSDVQAGFVDEPRRAVEHADALVADVMKRLAESFAAERKALEQQWDRGDQVTTEDLRVALQRYRSFFDRLLAI
jgi:hypothetical protein